MKNLGEKNHILSPQYFEQYNNSVIDFFKDKPGQLLVLNIPGGDGWEKLCPFLNLPIVDEKFPHISEMPLHIYQCLKYIIP